MYFYCMLFIPEHFHIFRHITDLTPNHDIWWMSICSRGSSPFWSWGITGEGNTKANPKLKLPRTAENAARKSFPCLERINNQINARNVLNRVWFRPHKSKTKKGKERWSHLSRAGLFLINAVASSGLSPISPPLHPSDWTALMLERV